SAEALGLLIVIGVAAAAWLARRRIPVLTFGVVWLAIGLLPVSNVLIPTGIVLAERTLFLPSIGLVIALGGLAAWLLRWDAASPQPGRASPALPLALGAAGALLVIAGVVRSAERQRIWRSEDVLAERT